jgi:hypothetical protein
MQAVEIRYPVDPHQHRFTVYHKRTEAVAQCGFDDERISVQSWSLRVNNLTRLPSR